LDFLQQHVLLPGRPPAVLVCHSIGCHMVLHALRRLEEAGAAAPGAPAVVKVRVRWWFRGTSWGI
jgi:predicted alpha/beta hydrolase family esterase